MPIPTRISPIDDAPSGDKQDDATSLLRAGALDSLSRPKNCDLRKRPSFEFVCGLTVVMAPPVPGLESSDGCRVQTQTLTKPDWARQSRSPTARPKKMFKINILIRVGAAALTLAAAPLALAGSARADACDRLWYKRNAIYADAGYCFKTERARAVFGPGCHPPYGHLSPWAQRRINEIQAEEDDLGCPR